MGFEEIATSTDNSSLVHTSAEVSKVHPDDPSLNPIKQLPIVLGVKNLLNSERLQFLNGGSNGYDKTASPRDSSVRFRESPDKLDIDSDFD